MYNNNPNGQPPQYGQFPNNQPQYPQYPQQYPQSGQNFPPPEQQGSSWELIRARCTQGKLVITDQAIRVELFRLQSQTIARMALVGIDYKLAVPSLFGLGGGANLVFHGQGGERLHANLVKPKIAKQIMRMLGY